MMTKYTDNGDGIILMVKSHYLVPLTLIHPNTGDCPEGASIQSLPSKQLLPGQTPL